MLDFLRAVISSFVSIVPNAIRAHRQKRVAQLGAGLYLTYIRMNEASTCGRMLVQYLEEYVREMPRYVADGTGSPPRFDVLEDICEQQLENIERVREVIQKWERELAVIDTEDYLVLRVLFNRKLGVLRSLRDTLAHGALPLYAPSLNRIIDEARQGSSPLDILLRRDYYDHGPHLSSSGHRLHELVGDYLRDRKPNEQLDAIDESLGIMRQQIASNFDIMDVLLEVGHSSFDMLSLERMIDLSDYKSRRRR